MRFLRRFAWICACVSPCLVEAVGEDVTTSGMPRNVVLVTLDGMRWQDVYRGADDALLNERDGGVVDVAGLRRDFWRDSPEARREALMPFVWSVVAKHGQLYGNRDKGSLGRVTNGRDFSYPGYNEMLTGAPDNRIDSNDKKPNPNVSVLEWLNGKPDFRGKVGVVGSWDVYPFILNTPRSGLRINAGWEPIGGDWLTAAEVALNRQIAETPHRWADCRDDAITFPVAMEAMRRESPRVFYIGLGDTDEHAHQGRYDLYLRAAHDIDASIRKLWDELQERPQYRGRTTLILTTDHGRGGPPKGWRSHNATVKGSDAIWLAVLGPDTPALGERANVPLVNQSQVAATLAAAVGEDYAGAVPSAAKPIAEAIKTSRP